MSVLLYADSDEMRWIRVRAILPAPLTGEQAAKLMKDSWFQQSHSYPCAVAGESSFTWVTNQKGSRDEHDDWYTDMTSTIEYEIGVDPKDVVAEAFVDSKGRELPATDASVKP